MFSKWYTPLWMHTWMCACSVCVCVCVRGRERERENLCMSVCVCVCEMHYLRIVFMSKFVFLF